MSVQRWRRIVSGLVGAVALTAGAGDVPPAGAAVPRALRPPAVGDVYVVGDDSVLRLPAGGGPATPFGTDLSYVLGAALDPEGNIYVADVEHGRVVRVPADGGAETTFAGGDFPGDVAFDAATGDLYVVLGGRLVRIPAGGGARTTVGPEGSGRSRWRSTPRATSTSPTSMRARCSGCPPAAVP